MVSRRPLGLAVRAGLLVVRRRFLVVSRLVALGDAPAGGLVVGTSITRLPKWWPRPIVPIRPDGTLAVEIDTAIAKAAHPDQDQRYEITAEVTDQSRRTIVGTGTVLVARKPFSVYTWVDRGHYRVGDTIEAGISAQTLAHKPVAGKGTLKLLKIAYDAERRPVETLVESWDLALDADGQARQAIKASAAGPVPAGGDDRRRQGTRRSKGATCSRSPGKDSTVRASASTTWRSSPSGRSTGPARRSGS